MQGRFLLVARTAIAAAMLVLVAPLAAFAGGKAEPLRIEFKRGAYSATISESVAHRPGIESFVNFTSLPSFIAFVAPGHPGPAPASTSATLMAAPVFGLTHWLDYR